MFDDSYPDILGAKGFRRIGQLDFQLTMQLWWHPDHHIQLLIIPLGEHAMIRGDSVYYLQARRGDDDTWVRDIEGLHQYLETHFANDLRLSFSFIRDLPDALAEREAKRHLGVGEAQQPIPTAEAIAVLQQQLESTRRSDATMARMMSLSASPNDLLGQHVQRQSRHADGRLRRQESDLKERQQRRQLFQQFAREYARKGSGAVLTFSVASNLHVTRINAVAGDDGDTKTRDVNAAIDAIIAELNDYDRFQIRQKLNGGRLKIQVAKAIEPAMSWIELWAGGALSPQQLHQVASRVPAAAPLVAAADDHIAVTPDEPIKVDGTVREHPQHLAAHITRSMLSRIDIATPNADTIDAAEGKLLLRLGTTAAGEAALLPLKTLGHMLVSGTTGSGKSIFVRTFCEEVVKHPSVHLLILDPRNQFGGAMMAETRPAILRHYERFGMQPGDARGMDVRYFAPGSGFTPMLPEPLSKLAEGRTVVSFKHVDETERCNTAADILNAAFQRYSRNESDQPRLLIVTDEAQLFFTRRVNREAAPAAARCEQAFDRIGREGRKHGVQLCLCSQTVKSFGHNLAVLRQMAGTKLLFRNSDLELGYAADMLPDPRALVHLPTGTAMLHNAATGVMTINIRPPLSFVGDVDDQELKTLLTPTQTAGRTLSNEAAALLKVIEAHATGSDAPINVGSLAVLANITSRRRLHALLDELERVAFIRTRRLPERGMPRIIELCQVIDR